MNSTYSGMLNGDEKSIFAIVGGTEILTGNNTFSGTASIGSNTRLLLSETGSIRNSVVVNSGIFDISASTYGTSIKSLLGSGSTNLGSQVLVLNNASHSYSGVLSGDTKSIFAITGGSETLTGSNTYTGTTSIYSGASLALSGSGSIANSSNVINGGSFDISGTSSGAAIKSLSGSGATNLGGQTLTLSNAVDNYSGVLSGTNGNLAVTAGSETLSGSNTYTGTTTINSGSSLALSGSGSIANSLVVNSGNLDISAVSNGAAIKSLSGAGATFLGNQTLTLNNANDSYSGVLSGSNGSVSIASGTETLSGKNTYSGTTSVSNGASLVLSGVGAIANSRVANSGSLDISGTANGSSINSLSGAGTTNLGSQILTLTNANDSYSGVLSGTKGSLIIAGGTEILSGSNTYSGGTQVNAGANLSISSNAALGTGKLDLVGSNNAAATLTTTASTTIANSVTVSGSSIFNIAKGSTTTVSAVLADGTSSGNLAVQGGGALNLTAINTYTGPAAIDSSSSLVLSGAGALANSRVTNSGTFDISATNNGAAIKGLSGPGTTLLGNQTLTLNNANDSYSGVLSGTNGNLVVTGGTQTLTGSNIYTGATVIENGTSLALSGTGSIANSQVVGVAGTLDISGTSHGTSITSLSGAGNTTLGNQTLTLSNAKETFSGVLTGTNGNLAVTGGTETLAGNNTYSGTTTIGSHATLALSGNGSIANSTVANSGTFNTQNSSQNVTVAGFSQAASGLLTMNFAPSQNQALQVNGATSLAGGLSLRAADGNYVPGHYTLLTSTSLLSGGFSNVAIDSSLVKNLNPNLSYSLSYDAHDVYLNLFTINNQAALHASLPALQSVYALQSSLNNNNLNYDINNLQVKVIGTH